MKKKYELETFKRGDLYRSTASTLLCLEVKSARKKEHVLLSLTRYRIFPNGDSGVGDMSYSGDEVFHFLIT